MRATTHGSKAGGSSPRVRGKRRVGRGVRLATGLIPARAGKTVMASMTHAAPGAHPRACGENVQGRYSLRLQRGSSPRVRGKPVGDAGREVRERLIPARAGKTRSIIRGPEHRRAHPRACGENHEKKIPDALAEGSSPRVRGKHSLDRRIRCSRGLIPARAGKTPPPGVPASPRAAHPRACGENELCMWRRDRLIGSSPRVRGKRPRPRAVLLLVGLIPARAGKTRR